MLFACSACNRSVESSEAFAYCPFCGRAYSDSAIPQQDKRGIIESDRETTVQEKYWRMTRHCFYSALSLLSEHMFDTEERREMHYDLNAWLKKRRRYSSVAQFQKDCEALMEELSSGIRQDRVEAAQGSIDIHAQVARIDSACFRLAESLRENPPGTTQPALGYEEKLVVKSEKTPLDKSTEAYMDLLFAVQESKTDFYRLLAENGLYVAFSVTNDLPEDHSPADRPMELAESLKVLSKKDYDPIFGIEHDAFVMSFWESIMLLMNKVNSRLELPNLDEEEKAKREALEQYLQDWEDILDLNLDRTYQNHEVNMMYVFSEAEDILKELQQEISKTV